MKELHDLLIGNPLLIAALWIIVILGIGLVVTVLFLKFIPPTIRTAEELFGSNVEWTFKPGKAGFRAIPKCKKCKLPMYPGEVTANAKGNSGAQVVSRWRGYRCLSGNLLNDSKKGCRTVYVYCPSL